MRILGIDPGLADTGWALLHPEGPSGRVVEAGMIQTPARTALPERLRDIHRGVSEIIGRLQPAALAIEQLYFTPMAKTQFATSQARGVILLAAAQAGVPVSEYNPREVKQSLTGNGNAAKPQMQRMVQQVLGLKEMPKPDDVADAMAIALCHLRFSRFKRMVRTS